MRIRYWKRYWQNSKMKERLKEWGLKSTVVVLCLLTVGIARAQNVRVLNNKDNKPVEDVFIFDHNFVKTSVTNANGEASLNKFDDTDTLYFQHSAFKTTYDTKASLKSSGYTITMDQAVISLGEFEFSSAREEEKEPDKIAHSMHTIGAQEIALQNPQTSADMLQVTGDIMVQKSQMGGGSPIIRGFEANKILLVVDGVRMNNAIYRGGHLQNAITVDNNILENTEVLFGPGSVIYGSDALGGVIHFHTRKPELLKNDSLSVNFNINAMTRYASANEEKTAHVDFNYGLKKIGFLTSVTASEFGDLTMGKVREHSYPEWGKVNYYTETVEGVDVMIKNSNSNKQVFTGYQQLDLLQKVLFKPSDSLEFIANIQYSTSSNVPRFDKLIEYNGDELRFAEWYYGPQKRLLTSINTRIQSGSSLFSYADFVVAFQRINEDRIDRRFGRTGRTTNEEDVNVYSINGDLVKKIDASQYLYYGTEFTYNDVTSTAREDNVVTGAIAPAVTRYPDGGSTMQTYAAYLNYRRDLSTMFNLTAGIRYSHAILNSQFLDTTFLTLPFSEVAINTGAFTGSLGLTFRPDSSWKFSLLGSTGFRSPNVDDYGKVFEKDGFVVVPSDRLSPEYAYNGELSITKGFHNNAVKLMGTFYYTFLVDAIVRRDHQLNGSDSLLYDGELARIQTNTNAAEAVIYGYQAKIVADISKQFTFESTYNYTFGEDLTEEVPLAHIPPVFGKTGVRYKHNNNKWYNDFYVLFNGWKRIQDYSPGSTDNPSDATEDGTPSWYTLNFKTTYHINTSLNVQFAVENILDHHYKQFASGISAPGRNFIIALRTGI